MHQERLGELTADQKRLLLPQICFVKPSLGSGGRLWQAAQPGPLIWPGLSNRFRQTALIAERESSQHTAISCPARQGPLVIAH